MRKNFRRSYWLLSGFVKKHLPKIVLTAIVTSLALVAIPQLIQRLPTGKVHQKIGRVGQFDVRQLPLDIQRLISSGLTDISPSGTATPSLALKWDISDDGLTYKFKLNDSIAWHDGEALQAADITYNFEDIDLNILSSTEVEFKLKEPFAPFPTAVSTPLFRKSKVLSKLFKRSKSELVGTGQYQVIKVAKRGQFIDFLTLESKEEKRTYKFYTTEEAAILGFKLGEVNVLSRLSSPKHLSDWKNLTITPSINTDRYVAVFFNLDDPNLADKNFRQALTYAIPDKPTDDSRALGPTHPDSWAVNSQIKQYATSPTRAQELMAEILDDNAEFSPSIRLDTTLAYLDLAEKIKVAWENLGVTTEVRVVNFPPPEYQALLAVRQISPDPDQYTLWHSTQSTNLTRLKNPKIDKLLEDGRKTLKQSERKQIYQDFQRFLLEESPAAFLFYQTTYDVTRN